MSKISLYEISNKMELLGNSLLNGEITEEFEQQEKELEDLLITKTDSIVQWRSKQQDFISSIDKRLDELVKLKSQVKNSISNLDKYVIGCMERLEKSSINGEFDKIMLPKRRKVIQINDEKKIPDVFKIITKTLSISKKQIGDAIKNGTNVPGAEMIDSKQSIKYTLRSASGK